MTHTQDKKTGQKFPYENRSVSYLIVAIVLFQSQFRLFGGQKLKVQAMLLLGASYAIEHILLNVYSHRTEKKRV